MGLWLIDKDGNKVRISDPGVTTFNGRTGDIISSDGDYTASQVGAVPMERRINGKTLNEDITLSAADVGARPSTWTPTAAQVGARPDTWTSTASDVGAVPTNRKVNGKSLSTDISLTAADVEARPSTWTPTATQVGALPTTGGTVSGKTTFSGGLAVTSAVANNDMPYFLGIEPFAAGGDVKYIAKGNMLSCIGAAASSHSHAKGT